MTIEVLQKAKISAMRAGDAIHKNTISDMIDAVQKASITSKGRVEITEQLTDEVLIKYQKTVQEMIDTCPADRTEKLDEYQTIMSIVKEFAPQLITDESAIRDFILDCIEFHGFALSKSNRGQIMKVLSPKAKGKADMKVVNKVLGEMLQ